MLRVGIDGVLIALGVPPGQLSAASRITETGRLASLLRRNRCISFIRVDAVIS